MTQALIVAAPRSGSGKTIVTLALLAALRRRGVAVRAGKSGPDYIDPAFHAAACGAPGVNLDSWAMAPGLMDALIAEAAGEELFVVESSMGLFDGVTGQPGRTGAAADIAARLDLPVVLVLDISGQSQSAAAVARGFAGHDKAVRVAGVILNRVASPRHRAGAEGAMAAIGLPVLGAVPRDATLALPERHLGLVQAGEHGDLPARLAALADMAEAHLDLGAIAALAAPLRLSPDARPPLRPPGQRIALARDGAFSFVYPHLLRGWRRAGAEIVPFSPLAGEGPDPGCDCCWLPGGYPELHAGTLAGSGWLERLRRFAATRPVHGECGGYMVLGQALIDAEGTAHGMAGLLGHAASFARRRMQLGYRAATLLADGPLGPAGTVLRGHEFHYATLAEPGEDPPFAAMADGAGGALPASGGRRGRVSGTFFHSIAEAR